MKEEGKVKLPKIVEYIVVSDKDNTVLITTYDRKEAKRFASAVRRAGGEVSVFRRLSI